MMEAFTLKKVSCVKVRYFEKSGSNMPVEWVLLGVKTFL